MRDDLHRGLSLTRHWRAVVARLPGGSWQAPAAHASERALLVDAKNLISSDFVPRLEQRIVGGVSGQGLFGPIASSAAVQEATRSMRASVTTPLEGRILSNVEAGAIGMDVTNVGDFLRQMVEASLREHDSAAKDRIVQEVAEKSPRDVGECRAKLRALEVGQPIEAIAKMIADGVHSRQKTPKLRSGVSLDEDLLK